MAVHAKHGLLAAQFIGKPLPLQVLRSAAGHYIGTSDEEGPCSRESVEYWPKASDAEGALQSGTWTQRTEP